MKMFDKDLECDLQPLGYIEARRIVKTKKAGKLIVIAYGALNYLGHYAPEFGGVAVVHVDPCILIAHKYIPWNPEGRKIELDLQYEYLMTHEMSAPEIAKYLYYDANFILPAMKQRFKEEYYQEIAEENKQRAKELVEFNKRMQEIHNQALEAEGDRVAVMKQTVKPRTPAERRAMRKAKEGPKLHIVEHNDQNKINGEEMIPFDDEEE